MVMISMINASDEKFKQYSVKVADVAFFMQIDVKNAYREIDKITNLLMSRVLHIPIDSGDGWYKTHWVSTALCLKGQITFEFDHRLLPYLTQLKSRFTSAPLDVLVRFSSARTMRMYLLLKQYELIGSRTVSVESLRIMLGAKAPCYEEFKKFNAQILKKAQKELSSIDKKTGLPKSEISFEMDYVRKGRKVVDVVFNIKPINRMPSVIESALTRIIRLGIAKKTAEALIKKHPKKTIEEAISQTEICQSSNKISKSASGYFLSIINANKPKELKVPKRKLSEITAITPPSSPAAASHAGQGDLFPSTPAPPHSANAEGDDLLSLMSDKEKKEFEIMALAGNQIYLSAYKKHGFKSAIVRSLTKEFLLSRT